MFDPILGSRELASMMDDESAGQMFTSPQRIVVRRDDLIKLFSLFAENRRAVAEGIGVAIVKPYFERSLLSCFPLSS